MKEGWERKKLGEVGQCITGSTPSTKDKENYSSDDYCFVKPSDIAKEGITKIFSTEFYVSKKAFSNSRQLPKGSVLVTCIGIIGKVGITDLDCITNQQINAIVPNESILPNFLAYSILSKRYLLENMANAPVVPIINKSDFSKLPIPVPPLSEQKQIVSELDLLSSVIEKYRQQLKDLDTLAQAIFYDMFKNEQNYSEIQKCCKTITGYSFKSNDITTSKDGGGEISTNCQCVYERISMGHYQLCSIIISV